MKNFSRKNFGVRLLTVLVGLLMVGLYAPGARAARMFASGGAINGVVVDKTDVPVHHAQVELDDAASGAMKDITTTDDTGGYGFQDVMPGHYVVKITADGFLPWMIHDVSVSAGNTTTLARVKLRGR
jgi:hypothetical protein